MIIGNRISIARRRFGQGAAVSYLLDTYTGAAAAYSLRQLKTGVTSVVRVRRSSDNTEQDFTATEVTDGTLTTFCGAGNGFVVTWYDQSGNANNATQATAGNQPQIVSAGALITANGLPTTQYVAANDTKLANANAVDITTDISIYVAIEPTTNANVQDGAFCQIGSVTPSADNYIAVGFRDGGYFSRLVKSGSVSDINGLDVSSISLDIISDVFDYSAATNIFRRNASVGSNVNAGRSVSANSNGIVIGGRLVGLDSFDANAKISEFIIYTSDQSGNTSGIESNMNTYFSAY